MTIPCLLSLRGAGKGLVCVYVRGAWLAQGAVVTRVAEHLGKEFFAVGDGDVGDAAVGIGDGSVDGVDEAAVGGDVEGGVAFEHFAMEVGVDFDGVFFNEVGAGLGVACALDALNFSEELPEEVAEACVVVNLNEGFAVAFDEFYNVVRRTLFDYPVGDELAIAHVGSNKLSKLYDNAYLLVN